MNSRRQRGAALLVALAAVALAAVLAVTLLERVQRDLARTAALSASERSWQYARGMDALAREWIALAESQAAGRLDGRWSEPFPVPGGQVSARVFDQSGRFNLNALAHPDPVQAGAARDALSRLLGHLELEPALAVELAAWVRGGIQDGAVDPLWYASREPPYRAPGQPMAHSSELAWLRHADEPVRQRLAPFVTVLPDFAHRINLNSTRPEVLAAWTEGLDVDRAGQFLAAAPFRDLGDALAHPLLTHLDTSMLQTRFGVGSHWYLAQARVVLDGVPRDYYRLIRTGGGGYDFRYFSQG